jgi:hypothetical protein
MAKNKGFRGFFGPGESYFRTNRGDLAPFGIAPYPHGKFATGQTPCADPFATPRQVEDCQDCQPGWKIAKEGKLAKLATLPIITRISKP